MADGHSHLGQTDSKIYGFFENDINAGSNNAQYSHHSRYWESKVNEQAFALEQQMSEDDQEPSEQSKAASKTVDLGEVYDKMAVQTGYEHHSKYWQAQVAAAEQQLDKEMQAEDEASASQKA